MERGIELKKCFAKDQLTNTPASSSPGQPRRSLDFWEQLLFLGIAASHCLTVFLCIYVIPFPGILNFIYILILLLLWSMWRNEVVMFHFLLFFGGTLSRSKVAWWLDFSFENSETFHRAWSHFSRSIPYLSKAIPSCFAVSQHFIRETLWILESEDLGSRAASAIYLLCNLEWVNEFLLPQFYQL